MVAVAVVITVAAVTAVAAVVTLAVVVEVADVRTATVVVIGLPLPSPEHATVVVPRETGPGEVESVSSGVRLVSGEVAPQVSGLSGEVSGGAAQGWGGVEQVSGREEPPELPSEASDSMFAVHISGDGEIQILVFMPPATCHKSQINHQYFDSLHFVFKIL